jgi:hypothetical protein
MIEDSQRGVHAAIEQGITAHKLEVLGGGGCAATGSNTYITCRAF